MKLRIDAVLPIIIDSHSPTAASVQRHTTEQRFDLLATPSSSAQGEACVASLKGHVNRYLIRWPFRRVAHGVDP